jgi:hypothetical protein
MFNPFNFTLYLNQINDLKYKIKSIISEKIDELANVELFFDAIGCHQIMIYKKNSSMFTGSAKFTTLKTKTNTNTITDMTNVAYYDYLIKYDEKSNVFSVSFNSITKDKDTNKYVPLIKNQCVYLFDKINEVLNDVYQMPIYKELINMINDVKKSKHFLLDNYKIDQTTNAIDTNKLANDLFQYYYDHINTFINLSNEYKNTNTNKQSTINEYRIYYNYLMKKYNINSYDFERDYLQYYFAEKMFIFNDSKVILMNNDLIKTNDSEPIIMFKNNLFVVKIFMHQHKYTNYHQPKYNVIIESTGSVNGTNTQTMLSKKIFNDFNNDQNLDYFYANLIDTIFCTMNELKN